MAGWRQRLWAGAALLLGLAAAGPLAAAGHEESLESAVKATYLYKFTPFVEWPPAAAGGPADAIHLCVAGSDPFGSVLGRAVAGQRLGERPFTVHRLRSAADGAGCHVLYVAPGDPAEVARSLQAVRGQPVLTVTDRAAVPEAKGVINFVLVDGRVRFEIDARAAADKGLMISSKLMSLAVDGGRG